MVVGALCVAAAVTVGAAGAGVASTGDGAQATSPRAMRSGRSVNLFTAGASRGKGCGPCGLFGLGVVVDVEQRGVAQKVDGDDLGA